MDWLGVSGTSNDRSVTNHLYEEQSARWCGKGRQGGEEGKQSMGAMWKPFKRKEKRKGREGGEEGGERKEQWTLGVFILFLSSPASLLHTIAQF